MEKILSFREWAIAQHEKTNHMYDERLGVSYTYHLKSTIREALRFKDTWFSLDANFPLYIALNAAAGHDLIEDARVTYNDIYKYLLSSGSRPDEALAVSEICLALSNFPGRNRTERASDTYYARINETPGAAFIKVCDRIANTKFSVATGSPMADVYIEEHSVFRGKLFREELRPMFEYLEHLYELKDIL